MQSNFDGFLESNARKKANFTGNSQKYLGKFCWKTIGKKQPILWQFFEHISLESDQFCTDLMNVFN